MTRAELHKLIDELPDTAVEGAGVLLRGIIKGPIDPDQAWFWTPEWLAGEREADPERAERGRASFTAAPTSSLPISRTFRRQSRPEGADSRRAASLPQRLAADWTRAARGLPQRTAVVRRWTREPDVCAAAARQARPRGNRRLGDHLGHGRSSDVLLRPGGRSGAAARDLGDGSAHTTSSGVPDPRTWAFSEYWRTRLVPVASIQRRPYTGARC